MYFLNLKWIKKLIARNVLINCFIFKRNLSTGSKCLQKLTAGNEYNYNKAYCWSFRIKPFTAVIIMEALPILIHTNFHRNRTGVTRSIENVIPFFEERFDAFILGYGIKGRKISIFRLLKIVLQKQYFVMHCHRNNEIILALFLRFIGGNFKLISTRHAEAPPSDITKRLLKKSDLVVALTPRMVKTLDFPTEVVGHGVDQQVFNTQVEVKEVNIRQKNILLCAGRVRESKGQRVLLNTLAPIIKKYPEWALAVVGKVDKPIFLKELEKIVEVNSIKEQVYFIDETPDIVSYYRAAHTVIVPSFTEGFSLVCAEAMSCGCNVIATKDVGIHSELIENEKDGYLFDINNESELYHLLTSLFKGELAHLGKKAQNKIAMHWSSKVEADRLMALYS